MVVNFVSFCKPFDASCAFIAKQFNHYTYLAARQVRYLSPYLENSWVTASSLFLVNAISFIVAVSICKLVHRFLKGDEDKQTHYLSLGILFFATVIVSNGVFCKTFKISLPVWKIIAISLAALISCVFCMCLVLEKLAVEDQQT